MESKLSGKMEDVTSEVEWIHMDVTQKLEHLIGAMINSIADNIYIKKVKLGPS
jgi:uncharacterized membrane protein